MNKSGIKVEYFREDLMNGKTRSKGGLSPRGILALFACRKRDSKSFYCLKILLSNRFVLICGWR